MFASFSQEAEILRLMRRLDVSLRFLTSFCRHEGIPKTSYATLTKGLTGGDGLRDTASQVLALLRRLDAFINIFAPLQIRLDNAAIVHQQMVMYETRQIKIFTMSEEVGLVERGGVNPGGQRD